MTNLRIGVLAFASTILVLILVFAVLIAVTGAASIPQCELITCANGR